MTFKIRVATGRGVADRWREQYYKADGTWVRTSIGDSEEKYNALCDLGPTPTPQQVADVIGNKSWSYLDCSGCHGDFEAVVEIDEHQDFTLCESCIREAAEAIARTKGALP